MFNKKLFKDTYYDTSYIDYKRYKTFSIYDTLNQQKLDYILNNLASIKYQALEICFDANNKDMLAQVTNAGFKPNYHWYS